MIGLLRWDTLTLRGEIICWLDEIILRGVRILLIVIIRSGILRLSRVIILREITHRRSVFDWSLHLLIIHIHVINLMLLYWWVWVCPLLRFYNKLRNIRYFVRDILLVHRIGGHLVHIKVLVRGEILLEFSVILVIMVMHTIKILIFSAIIRAHLFVHHIIRVQLNFFLNLVIIHG